MRTFYQVLIQGKGQMKLLEGIEMQINKHFEHVINMTNQNH